MSLYRNVINSYRDVLKRASDTHGLMHVLTGPAEDKLAADRPNQARVYNEFVPDYQQFVPGCFKTGVGHTRFGVRSTRVRGGPACHGPGAPFQYLMAPRGDRNNKVTSGSAS